MFTLVNKHKRILQFMLALVIIPPFAFWGIDSYQSFREGGGDVARIGDIRITEQEFGNQVREQQDRLRQLLGRAIDPATLDTPEARARILDGMISQRLLTKHVVENRMAVTDEGLRELISSQPAFQENGRFSIARYQEALKAQGYSAPQFEASVRRDLLVQQLSAAVAEASILSRAVAREWALLAGEQREVAQALVPASAYAAQVKATPEAIQAFDDANRKLFEVPEQVRVEYAVLSNDALAAADPVKPDEVKAAYESQKAQYEVPEERQASHILVTVKQGASEADKAKARARAEDILAQARKSPGSFAELAKKHSDDPGSAGKGGDLGFASRGMFVKPVEDAIFSLKAGEMAGPVESDFGYHVIRVTNVKPARARPFEEMRGEIEAALRKQRGGRRFAEAAESFSNLVYEQPDSLQPAAEKFGLKVQDGGWITREGGSKAPVLGHPRVLSALFSDEAIRNKRNTEAVEVASGVVVAARVAEHRPLAQRPLEEVRGEVAKRLVQKESSELAAKEGAQKLEQLRKGEAAGVSFGASRTITRRGDDKIAPDIVTAAFKVGRAKLPGYTGIPGPDGYRIVRVSKVVTPELDETAEKGTQAELGRDLGERQLEAYLWGLRSEAKVEVNRKALEKKAE